MMQNEGDNNMMANEAKYTYVLSRCKLYWIEYQAMSLFPRFYLFIVMLNVQLVRHELFLRKHKVILLLPMLWLGVSFIVHLYFSFEFRLTSAIAGACDRGASFCWFDSVHLYL